MAKNDNIIDFLGDVADAIREKKGISEPIAAQDFADEIKSIETDGIRYFDVRGFEDSVWQAIAFSCSLVKAYESSVGWGIITPGMQWGSEWHSSNVGAIAVDNREVIFGDSKMTILNFIKIVFTDIEATFPEITKEEFYDLTWEAPELPVG